MNLQKFATRSAAGPLALGSFLLLTMTMTAAAQEPAAGQTSVPRVLPVTGTLIGAGGAPLSGSVGLTFAIYEEAEGGSPLWLETQTVTVDTQGRFSAWVGLQGGGLPQDLFQSGLARWMGVTPHGLPEQPRGRFLAVPYALKAVDAERLGGLPASAFVINGTPLAPGASLSSRAAPGGAAARSSVAARQDPSDLEGPLDQVIPDDLIVQGSACVGLDCVNGEVFGFDTIRLKENNTRLQFEDTSAAGFPSNNWQIRANEAAAGGANFLAFVDQGAAGNSETGNIVFRVDAGAPTNAMKVASNGKVGFRQASPVLDLHMTTSDTPATRFEQTNAGGFTAQTWDVGANEANFFVRDVTGGSRLSFRIRPGAPTSSLDISGNGNVGIGTQSPGQKLDVAGHVRTNGTFLFASGSYGLRAELGIVEFNGGSLFPSGFRFSTTGSFNAMNVITSGNVGMGVAAPIHPLQMASGAHVTAGGAWTNASSRSLKEQIAPLTPEAAAATLDALQPMTYVYKADPGDPQVGFIAEDVPDLVATPDRASLASMDIVAVAVKVIQAQQRELAELRARLAEVERQLHETRRER